MSRPKKTIRLYFKYPSLKKLLKMTPKERMTFINKKFQDDLNKIRTILHNNKFQLIGTTKKPRGIEVESSLYALRNLRNCSFINQPISLKPAKVSDETYYCCKAIFQVQIEGQNKGMQTVEERMMVVRANSFEDAERKVIKESKQYAQPYLNPYGRLVRWTLEKIEDTYHTLITTSEDFQKPVEVFSKLRTRRLKSENVWNGAARLMPPSPQ